jgi:hypothetical protein
MGVASRFSQLLENLKLTDTQKSNGAASRESAIWPLNYNYYNTVSGTTNSTFIGSWAKFTRVRPPRDVDVLFTLPYSVYERFEKRTGNKQSQLLQEVKNILAAQFQNTAIRGDGPVVLVPFSTYNVEIVPAFSLTNGRYWVCMTNNGGFYKEVDYSAEVSAMSTSENNTKNTRDLVRIMKCWQSECYVPIKSFYLEILAIEFLNNWVHRGQSKSYYDWMVRDFLEFLVGKANGFVFAPGTYEIMPLGDAWKSKAESAHARAKKACDYEATNSDYLAGDEWQKIFGNFIPKYS